MNRLALGTVLAVLLTAAVGLAVEGSRSSVVYPEATIPLKFSHKKHLSMGLQCALCHAAIDRSTEPMGAPLPGHGTCKTCHQMDAPEPAELYPPATCETCHLGYTAGAEPAPVVIPAAELVFSHETHLRAGVNCADCHKAMETVDLATREQLPRMRDCVDCHKERRAPTECHTCHKSFAKGLVTELPAGSFQPSGSYMPDDHGTGWIHAHAPAARMDPQRCEACHSETACLACHDHPWRNPQVHPSDWLLLHPRAARIGSPNCQSCHRTESFCASCHRAVGLSASDPLQPGGRGVHPEGWSRLPRGPDHHSLAAERNITQCSACHEPETCTRCHGSIDTGGLSITPHAPGFRAAWMYRRNPTSCWQCHRVDDPALLGLEGGR
jgi:hypothetical protein